jgi:prepilin-type N-terminal cleavage/methylation domain-containing protein
MKKGFTLVEMIVATGIMLIVVALALTALLSVTAANRRAAATRKLVDNIGPVFESMTRDIRLGNTYHCDTVLPGSNFTQAQDCTDYSVPGLLLAFNKINPNSTVVYSWDSVKKKIIKSIDGGANYTDVNLPSISINKLNFYVYGSKSDDMPTTNTQARVFIVLQASSGTGKNMVDINLQTTIMQRSVDR